VEEQKLLASDCAEADNFGFPVAVSGDTAEIAAPGSDEA
ncbi:MAG: FG-GAP repeat protein, partial [Phycisphaerales bacterium]